ncbi:orotate phosphoribosyltransferase [Haliangium sp.]|uniref:orotate phosphoribosyltransferase n=1 Tax=Haliangium sp. TaxID=2663208 RepID=UPI003D134FBA
MTPWRFDDPVLAHQRARLLALLSEHAFSAREVVLSSGKRSNFYIDCKQVSLHAEGGFLIGQLMRAVIDRVAPEAEAVGGLTMGADPLATAVSVASFVAGRPLHAFLVRKEAKGHGTGAWLEGTGNLRPDMPVVVLEDVVTTGGSTIRAIHRARAGGLRVIHVLALVDREEEGGREAVEAQAPLTALYGRRDFMP